MKKNTFMPPWYTIFVKVVYGGVGITNASGSLGGSTFSHNAGGAYVRTKVIPVNPDTPEQASVRNEFGSLSQQWRTLTQTQRNSWIAARHQFTFKDTLGNTRTPSGINLFKSLNQNLFDAGQATILTAPQPTGTTNATRLTVVATSGADTIALAFVPSPVPAGMEWLIHVTPQVSPGINFVKNKYVILEHIAAATASPQALGPTYVARFGALISGQKLFIGIQAVNILTGEKSTMLTTSAIVI